MAIKLIVKQMEVPIHCFGKTKVEGDASMKNLLGGKGANLCEMAKLEVPVPPGFIIPTSMCAKYNAAKGDPAKLLKFQEALKKSIQRGIQFIEADKGASLLSVRSGARVSMPGMMDTILNVGLDKNTKPFWYSKLGNVCGMDSASRLIEMYSGVVKNIPRSKFEGLDLFQRAALYEDLTGEEFPEAGEQLLNSVLAVFESWNNPRAIEYRKIHGIPDDWGTAVTVQAMVFGNMGETSATGVLFSRNPSTGEDKITGEFLVNAQGEDVVAGVSTPEPLSGLQKAWSGSGMIYHDLLVTVRQLEKHYQDMQDIEFTIENGKLYILQTRNGKRSAKAAFKIAYDMVAEGLTSKEEAGKRVTKAQLKAVMSDTIDPAFKAEPTFVGIAAGGSIVSGVAMLSSTDAINCKEPCILVTKETDPDDIGGMNASVGILTATGGLTSHAAVVARGMNKSCVVGVTTMNPIPFSNGTKVTIDGSTGNVWVGIDVPVIKGDVSKQIVEVASWALGKADAPVSVYLKAGMTAEEMSANLKSVPSVAYIEAAPLVGLNSPQTLTTELVSSMTALKEALGEYPDLTVVINFADPVSLLSPEDEVFYDMFNYNSSYVSQFIQMANRMLEWPEYIQLKVTVTGAVPDVIKKTSCDFTVSGSVFNFADLLSAKGSVDAPDEIINTVFGGKDAFDKAVQMVSSATGNSLTGKVLKGYYWYEFLTGESNASNANV